MIESNNLALPGEAGNFVVMDNGTRFYLHVIGIFPSSQSSTLESLDTDTTSIQ